jgi:hypothetical protein
MLFGVINIPAVVQGYFNNSIREVLNHIALPYLDDVLTYSNSKE